MRLEKSGEDKGETMVHSMHANEENDKKEIKN